MPCSILTYTKVRFNPLRAKVEDIRIEDIAHSLSLMTRANGHCRHFYSVAQHSIACCREAVARGYTARVQLGCLLHDASESYISDITRPVKINLPEYVVIEKRLQNVIYERFGLDGLTAEELELIRNVDDTLLYYELEALMDLQILDEAPYKAMEHEFKEEDWRKVEQAFLSLYDRIDSMMSDLGNVESL
ncbi:MAG: phosphohydrolase [Peptococcia bacterium]